MREQLKPVQRARRTVAGATLSVLAATGLSGCAEPQLSAFTLSATCEDNAELRVANIGQHGQIGHFELSCTNGSDSSSPLSVEIVASPDAKYSDSMAGNVAVDIKHGEGDLPGFNSSPEIRTVQNEDFTRVVVDNINSFGRVAVIEPTQG